jgi:O-antigen/teichoic acid export membrane protein
MSTGHRIIKNSIVLTVSQILSKIINIGLIVILTRLLGKEGFGLYSFSFAYVSLFGYLTHLGLVSLLAREIAKYKDQAGPFLSNTFPFVLISSVITLLLLNVIAFALDWNITERTLIFFFGFYLVFDAIGRYFLAVTRAFEKMEYVAIVNFVERLFLLFVATLCWILNFTLIHLIVLFMLVQLFKAILSYFIISKFFTRFRLKWLSDHTWKLLKEAYPFALTGIFLTVSLRIDLLFLKYFHSTDVVGVYSAARRLIESLNFIPENIYFAVYPALSVLYVSQKDKFDLTFKRTLIILSVTAVPLSVCLYILAPRIINLLFSSEFSGAAVALRWLSIALFIIFVRYAFAVTLNSIGKQFIFSVIIGISMLINIAMNIILVPQFEIIGASIAVICSELSIIICCIPLLSHKVNFAWFKSFIPKIVIMAVIMFITISVMKEWHFSLIILISTSIFIGLLFILNLIRLDELKDYYNNYKFRE